MEAQEDNSIHEATHLNGSMRTTHENGRVSSAEYTDELNIDSSLTAMRADNSASSSILEQQQRGSMQQSTFSEELVGIRVCFQLVDLGRQLYIWAGLENGAMGCMCLAAPPQSAGKRPICPR